MKGRELLYRVTGRMSLACEAVRDLIEALRGSKRASTDVPQFDKTGLLVQRAMPLPIWWQDEDVIFVKYPSLAHSLWRAQEFSLFRRHIGALESPILDFGCGDGSFASVLFKRIDYGVDSDPAAIEVARGYGIYQELIVSSVASISVASASVRSIMSNSVLEHLLDLQGMVAEFARILAPGGILMFTVPVSQFTEDLAKYFGRRESLRINAESSHHNLLSQGEWQRLLARHGFVVEVSKPYQPDGFTYWYRMLRLVGRRGLGILFRSLDERIWKTFGGRLVDMVRASVNSTSAGGNLFIVCRKP